MGDAIRLDKWLWYARFFKSRSLAAKLCQGNRVRVNRAAVGKPSAMIRVGDVLTFPQGTRIRVVEVCRLGNRRGPAAEAQTLYRDLAPPEPRPATGDAAPARRARGVGRPTKAERRAIERLREGG